MAPAPKLVSGAPAHARRLRRELWLRLVGGLCVACTIPSCASNASVPRDSNLSVEVGTGTTGFEPLVDGAELPLTHGAQGGWHMWISARVGGLVGDTASIEIAHQPADESEPEVVTRAGTSFDPADAEGRRATLGWQAILTDPSCSVGRLHRVRVTVTTASGARASAECEVIPTGGNDPPPACTD